MSDLGVRTVSINGAKSALRHAFRKRRPIFIWGPPGIGKSDIVKQIGDEQDREVVDVRLSLWEPTDIKGIPYYYGVEIEIEFGCIMLETIGL